MNGIETLIGLNGRHSRNFTQSGLALERRLYRSRHRTQVAALKCMDGRLNLSLITGVPLGIVQPFRNLGGQFEIGWPMFQEALDEWVQYGVSNGRESLLLVTYHFSRGEKHRGCKGFNYDTEAARAAAFKLTADINDIFAGGAFRAIPVGIETDLDALILHGENNQTIDVAQCTDFSEDDINDLAKDLYPTMPEQIRQDFHPLMHGNIVHVRENIRTERPPEDIDHGEWVIAVGRGFDWLHTKNTALIVGPFSPDLVTPIRTAVGVIQDNFAKGRIGGQGIVVMTAAPYRKIAGPEQKLACAKALFLLDFTLKIVKNTAPEFEGHLQALATSVYMSTRHLEVLRRDDVVVW